MSSKQEAVRKALEAGVCPECGKPAGPDSERFGTGRIDDGYFCSLDCLGTFYEDENRERHRQSGYYGPDRNN